MFTVSHQATYSQLPNLAQEMQEILRAPHTGQQCSIREFLAQELSRECRVYSLDKLCELSRGRHISQAQIAQQAGDYPIYSSATQDEGKIGMVNFFDHEGQALTWTTDGVYAGTIFPRTGKFALTVHCGLIVRRAEFAHQLDYSYLHFYLQHVLRKLVNTATRQPMLGLTTLRNVQVVVPSLKVQRLLGIIFDLGVANTASLDAELHLRQLQLSYYRELLLKGDSPQIQHAVQILLDSARMHAASALKEATPTTHLPLAYLAELHIGDAKLTRAYIASHRGNYPVYSAQTHNSGVSGYIDSYQQEGEYLTWSLVGYAGRFFYRQGRFNAGPMCGVLQITQPELVYGKYLYQVLQLQAPALVNTSSVMPMCNIKHLAQLQIPLLPYHQQVVIGNFLYDFEAYLTGELASLRQLHELRIQQLDYYQQSLFNQLLAHASL